MALEQCEISRRLWRAEVLTERGCVHRTSRSAHELRRVMMLSTTSVFRSCCGWSSTQPRSGDSVAPACEELCKLLFGGGGVWFASKFMKAIQGYHLIKSEDLFWRPSNL